MRKIFSIFLKIIFFTFFAIFFFLYFTDRELWLEKVNYFLRIVKKEELPSERKFPAEQNPVKISYQWQYGGANYELTETFYQSSYDFYKSSPKSFKYYGDLPANWEEQFYGMFMEKVKGDNTLLRVAEDIQNLGRQKKLNDDQIVELILAFVQELEYDDAKAEIILKGGLGAEAKYPQETLFEKKGVCSDKSFLAASLLRELGYGTVLFSYEAERHMAIGVKCTKEYSSYNSGYCYAETTSPGFKIGVIPDIDEQSRAVAQKEISYFSESQLDKFNTKNLSSPGIFQMEDGKIYGGIIKTIQYAKEIESLKKEISSLKNSLLISKKRIDDLNSQLEEMLKKMEKYKGNADYEKYNDLVPKYNDLVDDVKKEVKKYNSDVAAYNQKVDRYNQLLKI